MSTHLILIAEIISSYLERARFRTVTAQDGALALAHFKHFKPDLVLSDVRMPRQDGIEVLRIIRQSSDMPVIMITAMVEDVEKISAPPVMKSSFDSV